jgi:hypothetical protein
MFFMKSKLMIAILMLGISGRSFAQSAKSAMDEILDRSIQREREIVKSLSSYTPMVETYLQHLEPHEQLGTVPMKDTYFLGKLDLKNGINQKSLMPRPGFGSGLADMFTRKLSIKYFPNGFAQMILVDGKSFDRANYDFTFVRREFLGEVRCAVFDVNPKAGSKSANFLGRIWIEDENYNIVRFNGTYTPSSPSKMFFHFDSWRENMGPGLWLPAYVYIEESDAAYSFCRKLRFKGQTRIWGYNVGRTEQQDELTSLTVESSQVRDRADQAEGMSPVRSFRAWERQAEDNILHRLQEAGLLAPAGQVNEVLETVVTNLEVTNNLNIQPGVRARVLLTTPLESFTVGQTIVLSRGLVDVLPDEASLAMVLAHELAHIALGHRLDTKYAFSDRMLFKDDDTFRMLGAKRDPKEEEAANVKAAEFLQNSPYKDKLANAGLFLRALGDRAEELEGLLRPHMGNHLAIGSKVERMAGLMKDAPALELENASQVAALPLGGRLRVNPWDNTIGLMRSEAVSLLSPREKMLFEVTPVFLFLTRQKTADTAAQR